MEETREQKIRLWFDMWLQAKDLGMEDLFAPDCVYLESWGPKYEGRDKVALWFREWNTRGRVVRWDVEQFFHKGDQTVVEWSFRNEMKDGTVEEFHGLSLVNYDPYEAGETPVFRDEPSVWF